DASKGFPGRHASPLPREDFLSRARRNIPVTLSFPHPLSWWRTRRAEEFKRTDCAIARGVLTRSAILGEPHWHLAAHGDTAVAIGVALRVQKRSGENLILVDVAMTAVLCCAVEGDATAALLLSATLKRRADKYARFNGLSDSWLVYSAKKRRQKLQSLWSDDSHDDKFLQGPARCLGRGPPDVV